MLKHLLGATLILGLTACATGNKDTETAADVAAEAPVEEVATEAVESSAKVVKGALFGAEIGDGDVLQASEVISHASRYADKEIILTGTIGQVCQQMGCWFEISDGEGSIRVKDPAHAVTIPLDSAGKTVVARGTFKVTELTEEMAAHLRDDGAKAQAGEELALELMGALIK